MKTGVHSMNDSPQNFSANLATEAQFKMGLRGCFEYRDLGINDATYGQYHAAISRVRPEFKGDQNIRTTDTHRHLCDFQMFYVLKGWVTMDYEGEGQATLGEGN
jgi:mannose-6-phosphate isomerase-like protein (cupin superfamily)